MDNKQLTGYIEHYWDLDKYISNHIYKLIDLRQENIFKENVVIGTTLSVVGLAALAWLIKVIWEGKQDEKNNSTLSTSSTYSNNQQQIISKKYFPTPIMASSDLKEKIKQWNSFNDKQKFLKIFDTFKKKEKDQQEKDQQEKDQSIYDRVKNSNELKKFKEKQQDEQKAKQYLAELAKKGKDEEREKAEKIKKEEYKQQNQQEEKNKIISSHSTIETNLQPKKKDKNEEEQIDRNINKLLDSAKSNIMNSLVFKKIDKGDQKTLTKTLNQKKITSKDIDNILKIIGKYYYDDSNDKSIEHLIFSDNYLYTTIYNYLNKNEQNTLKQDRIRLYNKYYNKINEIIENFNSFMKDKLVDSKINKLSNLNNQKIDPYNNFLEIIKDIKTQLKSASQLNKLNDNDKDEITSIIKSFKNLMDQIFQETINSFKTVFEQYINQQDQNNISFNLKMAYGMLKNNNLSFDNIDFVKQILKATTILAEINNTPIKASQFNNISLQAPNKILEDWSKQDLIITNDQLKKNFQKSLSNKLNDEDINKLISYLPNYYIEKMKSILDKEHYKNQIDKIYETYKIESSDRFQIFAYWLYYSNSFTFTNFEKHNLDKFLSYDIHKVKNLNSSEYKKLDEKEKEELLNDILKKKDDRYTEFVTMLTSDLDIDNNFEKFLNDIIKQIDEIKKIKKEKNEEIEKTTKVLKTDLGSFADLYTNFIDSAANISTNQSVQQPVATSDKSDKEQDNLNDQETLIPKEQPVATSDKSDKEPTGYNSEIPTDTLLVKNNELNQEKIIDKTINIENININDLKIVLNDDIQKGEDNRYLASLITNLFWLMNIIIAKISNKVMKKYYLKYIMFSINLLIDLIKFNNENDDKPIDDKLNLLIDFVNNHDYDYENALFIFNNIQLSELKDLIELTGTTSIYSFIKYYNLNKYNDKNFLVKFIIQIKFNKIPDISSVIENFDNLEFKNNDDAKEKLKESYEKILRSLSNLTQELDKIDIDIISTLLKDD